MDEEHARRLADVMHEAGVSKFGDSGRDRIDEGDKFEALELLAAFHANATPEEVEEWSLRQRTIAQLRHEHGEEYVMKLRAEAYDWFVRIAKGTR